jgi:hypothetical protein
VSFSPDRITIALDDISPESVAGCSADPLGVVWALTRDDDRRLPGVEIFVDSRVPIEAGLSSSAALESATAIALNELWVRGKSQVFCNLAITGLAVSICLLIRTIEVLGLLPADFGGLHNSFWNYVAEFNINTAGFAVVGMFISSNASWSDP